MTLADRARAALWGNINAILARLEQSNNDVPGLLEQMGQEIKKAKRELVRVMGEEKVLRERSKSQALDAHKWQSRAELAVRAADDKLARSALLECRRFQGESARDAAAADEYGALAQSVRADIAQMEEKHRGWTARQATIGTMSEQARLGGGVEALGARAERNPFDEFRRAEQSIENAELAVDAQQEVQELLAPSAQFEQQFTELQQSADSNAGENGAQVEPGKKTDADNQAAKRRVRIE